MKNTMTHLLLITLISAQTAFCASVATAPTKAEHEKNFPGLQFTMGPRELDGSFLAMPSIECMQLKNSNTLLPHEYAHFLKIQIDSGKLKPDNEQVASMRLEELIEQFGAKIPKPKRALACIGGGSKGLLEIISLAYLETIINEEENRNAYNAKNNRSQSEYIYISDLFDCGGGTSTGSIIVAGLFYNKDGIRYKAFEVAQLYVRCLNNIFGEKALFQETHKYSPKGLKLLLGTFFGTSKMKDSFNDKKVNIFAVRKGEEEAQRLVFGSDPTLNGVTLVDAILSSSAAPSFFPEHTFQIGDILYRTSDGGTSINDPSAYLVQHYNIAELYTFGAGHGLKDNSADMLSYLGLIYRPMGATGTLLEGLLAKERDDRTDCLKACNDQTKTLSFFAKINPKLEEGMDLDSTSDRFVHQSITAAIRETETEVFAGMVDQLGFKMPNTESADLKTVLCPYGYLGLTTSIRMQALKDIYTLNFSLLTSIDSTLEERKKLLSDYINKGVEQYGYEFLTMVLFNIPDGFNIDETNNLSQDAKNAFKFHQLAIGKISPPTTVLKVSFEQWKLLLNKDAIFPEIEVEDVGDEFILVASSPASPTSSVSLEKNRKLLTDILQNFLDFLNNLGITTHTARGLNLASSVYFKALTAELNDAEKVKIRSLVTTNSSTAIDTLDAGLVEHTSRNSGLMARLTGLSQTRLTGLSTAFKQYVQLVTEPSTALPEGSGAAATASPTGSGPQVDIPVGFAAMIQHATPEQIVEMIRLLQEKQQTA